MHEDDLNPGGEPPVDGETRYRYLKQLGWFRGAAIYWNVHRVPASAAVAVDVLFEAIERLTWHGWRELNAPARVWGRFWILRAEGLRFTENWDSLEDHLGWDGVLTSVAQTPTIEVPSMFQVVGDDSWEHRRHHVARLRDYDTGDEILGEHAAEAPSVGALA